MRSVVRSVALIGVLIATSSTAWAQSDEQRANARGLAAQGVQAFSEGRWQDSVDLFERAESLVDAPTHLLFGARAHVKLHHYVKARELYLRIIRQQLKPDAPRAFQNAHTSASQELKDAEPHIGQLTIAVRGPEQKAVKVTMDGAAVDNVLIGVSRPIDPGEHQIEAEAPGFAAQTKKVSIDDGGKASIVLELAPGGPPAEAVNAPPAASPPEASSTPLTTPSSTPTSDTPPTDTGRPSSSNKKRIAAYAAFGVGAVGLGVGAFFISSSASKRSQADKKFQECGGATGCTNDSPLSQQVSTLDKSASSAKTIGIVGLAAGGVGVAAGVVLFVLSREHAKAAAGLSVVPQVGLGSLGVAGTF